MRKMILLFILLSGFVAVITAAELKIALIGDSPVAQKAADLALTTLSKEKDIALLERGAIDKLLREHKLTRSGNKRDGTGKFCSNRSCRYICGH